MRFICTVWEHWYEPAWPCESSRGWYLSFSISLYMLLLLSFYVCGENRLQSSSFHLCVSAAASYSCCSHECWCMLRAWSGCECELPVCVCLKFLCVKLRVCCVWSKLKVYELPSRVLFVCCSECFSNVDVLAVCGVSWRAFYTWN